jgi:hypothetical protein
MENRSEKKKRKGKRVTNSSALHYCTFEEISVYFYQATDETHQLHAAQLTPGR